MFYQELFIDSDPYTDLSEPKALNLLSNRILQYERVLTYQKISYSQDMTIDGFNKTWSELKVILIVVVQNKH